MKSYQEINEKIRRREAVVVTADEILQFVEEKGVAETARTVDVVTTGTFGAMCSSGAFLNFGHPTPRIKASKVWINAVEAYAGLAAVDCYLGATQSIRDAAAGNGSYGGGHVIEDLVAGRPVDLEVEGAATDCYPARKLEKRMTLAEMPNAQLHSPRNAYQNYNCAVNLSDRTLHSYMGVLKPRLGNANYSGSGQLSPLMNDPLFRTIGVGTRIFLGGGIGFVTGPGTQHNPSPARSDKNIPRSPSGTLAVTGDLKNMSDRWLKGVRFRGYGVSLRVGLGVPIPILDEEVLMGTLVRDADIRVPVVDYSVDYPEGTGRVLGEVTVAEIRSGRITLEGKTLQAANLSDVKKAREIAAILKQWIAEGHFEMARPVERIPAF